MLKSIFSILIFLIFGLSEGICGETIIDRIIAIVNGEIITLSELDRYHSELREGSKATANQSEKRAKVSKSKREILDRLIEEKLVDQQCKKLAIKVSERDIDMAIEDVKRLNAITDEQLMSALLADGLSWEDYRQQLREQIKMVRLFSRVARAEFTVDEEGLKRFYIEHIERFKEPDQVRISHILITIPQDAEDLLVEALRHKAETILERLRRGEDFGELARLCSDDASAENGGDLGFFKCGELLPEFERVTFNLQPGQFSHLVRTKRGFHIIKVTEKKEGPITPYEEVMEKVKNQYIDEESQRLYKVWIQKVKTESFIEVKL
ncbi:MAG: peptidylprolyl isomerase [Syntrophobacterales bacterium]|nr:MAG: peptidylprolyl isomerase [Syntrophobacterales bacterium]